MKIIDINIYDGHEYEAPGTTIIAAYPTRINADGYTETIDTTLARVVVQVESPVEDTWIQSGTDVRSWPAEIRDSLEIVNEIERIIADLT